MGAACEHHLHTRLQVSVISFRPHKPKHATHGGAEVQRASSPKITEPVSEAATKAPSSTSAMVLGTTELIHGDGGDR